MEGIQGFAKWLFSLGADVAVYQTMPPPGSAEYPRFFWKYGNSLKVHGPFDTAVQASKHYEALLIALSSPETKSNVIGVDFNKRVRT